MTAIICGGVFACAFAAVDFRYSVRSLISAGWRGGWGEGKPSAPDETIISAGDQLSIAAGRASVEKVSPQELERRLSWATVQQTDGWLVFRGETVRQAADAFNRYNERQLVVGDPEVARLRLGGKFRANDVDGFVATLEVTHGVRAVRAPSAGEGHEVITLTGVMPKSGNAE
jgi:hypothetical protein